MLVLSLPIVKVLFLDPLAISKLFIQVVVLANPVLHLPWYDVGWRCQAQRRHTVGKQGCQVGACKPRIRMPLKYEEGIPKPRWLPWGRGSHGFEGLAAVFVFTLGLFVQGFILYNGMTSHICFSVFLILH